MFFFCTTDRFCKDKCSKAFTISDDGQKVHYKEDKSDPLRRWTASVFGEQVIDSMNINMIYIWKFKIIQLSGYYIIGISSAFDNPDAVNTSFGLLKYCYSYGNHGELCRNVDEWEKQVATTRVKLKENDILEMTLDQSENTLSYKINEKPALNYFTRSPVAFDDIAIGSDIKYRMAFSCHSPGDAIELLSFECKENED